MTRCPIGFSTAFLLYLITAFIFNGQSYTIQIADVDNCLGGTPCLQQPRVQIKNTGGFLEQTFVGSAYIQMGASPSGLEILYLGNCDMDEQCGTKVSGRNAVVSFIDGYATFQVRYLVASIGVVLTIPTKSTKVCFQTLADLCVSQT